VTNTGRILDDKIRMDVKESGYGGEDWMESCLGWWILVDKVISFH
jgi:hypothetical protein